MKSFHLKKKLLCTISFFSKEKVSFEGLWDGRIMTRFALNHSLPLAFYEFLASKGTRPFYSQRDDGQNFFIVEINF